jgi:hypothetical protein
MFSSPICNLNSPLNLGKCGIDCENIAGFLVAAVANPGDEVTPETLN